MAKVMISIPDKLLKAVDLRAKAEYETRSGLLREWIVEKVRPKTKRATTGNLKKIAKNFEEARKYTWTFPDGLTYQRKVRKEWDDRLKRIYGEVPR